MTIYTNEEFGCGWTISRFGGTQTIVYREDEYVEKNLLDSSWKFRWNLINMILMELSQQENHDVPNNAN